MNEKPAVTAGSIVTLIEAIVFAGILMNWWELSDAQLSAILQIVVAAVAVLSPIVAGIWTARKSTPLTNPKDVDGTRLLREDGSTPLKAAKP